MKKLVLSLVCLTAMSCVAAGEFSTEDKANVARSAAELKAMKRQVANLQKKIAQHEETHARLQSAAHSRAAARRPGAKRY